MTAYEKRQKVVDIMRSWIGRNEADGSHKPIIDIYNSKNARGKMSYSMEWCAATVSAAFIQAGLDELITPECSCWYMVEGLKSKGAFVESDAYEPAPGDIIFYNWSSEQSDHKNTDNRGVPEHTGIVEKYSDGVITTIEGNYSDSVKRRYVELNARYIRGFGVPKYEDDGAQNTPAATEKVEVNPIGSVTVKLDVLGFGAEGKLVAALQSILTGAGYPCGEIDGELGNKTLAALKSYQRGNKLPETGKTDAATWESLLLR